MKMQSSRYMLGTASVLALLASSTITPANAQASTATAGIYAGGSTLASEAFRQIFDCYMGGIVGSGTTYPDGFAFDSSFPARGKLPTTCTLVSVPVQGMYAGVGSGNGVRGFITNNPRQWYNGTVTPNASANISIATPLPANQPAMIDLANPGSPATKFGSYPYPRVDIGLSDSPLGSTLAALTTSSVSFNPTQGWTTTGGALTQITLNSTSTASVAYQTTVYGNPIQIPAFEVNVAIGVNTSTMTVNSSVAGAGTTPGTQANQGAAIQLTTGQLCAIFTGLVTDWNDVTANKIPYLDKTGTQQLAAFNYANANSGGTLQAYSSSSLPIKIVYRGDGSGTSFILTNYLKAVCPLLDSTGAFGYTSIFNTTTLPSTSFSNLITRINAVRGAGGWNNTTATNAWVPATGSGGVASAISTGSGNAGRIGYVSADFTQPYTTQVGTIAAPLSAALQNEQLRSAGTYVPNNSVTPPATRPANLTFIAPTPAGANAAWGDTRLKTPSTTWTWNDYNIYANVFGAVTQSGVTVTGLPVLPLTNRLNAYPLSGTTFLDLYSCYNVQADSNRVTNLVNFLTTYIAGADSGDGNFDPDVSAVVQNAGFHLVPVNYAQNIKKQYWGSLTTAISAAAATQANGCLNVANGASGGAK
ncbi:MULTISPECIES: substrate-binding domain-containing protein [unclassified Bradyrhizobium]|uniref:substrate-binding domain-containing protein n=1 Tax=unclassified Bradyrhizobium TaxID=2631580 RepID=UPI001BACF0F0|nr:MULTISPECIES: substrate-binding domain-containing protein [unclassified Bradyrhizobium]MBR1201881.1 substrate-binding domain-containing protein [Bradyrhizobium sp. AUGA SZCCT0124]MBR1311550.1 substrate-binding domain-containing protein [Bradyrhizobium sp. AUGA SZCCT0051]MBR1338830.1 substrate-binding domain-containing protein [Bradyrhizobium sp. AUGA SZCCT0105]MBR1353404.1 substrate-binding domain-containing protein [Bradyrhizobium sp. AUGA SZCCT0045]